MSAAAPSLNAGRRAPTRSYRDVLAASTARTLGRRRAVSYLMVGLTYLAAFLAILPLILISWHLLQAGAKSINLAFFLHMPKPPDATDGGMANAIAGTGIIVAIASAIGLPIGIGAGLYLAEQRGARLATAVRPSFWRF